jgi:putative Mn2+ efflux pump MntP
MPIYEILFISVGLAADAFSVAIGDGLCMPKASIRRALTIALAFGVFQAIMPLIGSLAAYSFARYIEAYDHIIALGLLAFIGIRMISEGIKGMRSPEDCPARELSLGGLFVQAVGTSIDALMVGISFAALSMSTAQLGTSVLTIGVITFGLSLVGVLIGKRVGSRIGKRAEIIGGAILIVIGLKIFIEHMINNV